MRKALRIIMLCTIVVIVASGCGARENSTVSTGTKTTEKDVPVATVSTVPMIEIKSKMFIQQCNDIYLNPDEYAGKNVHIEGICDVLPLENGEIQYGVIRYGPGCCGNDGVAGFVFTFDDPDLELKQNDWIVVEGAITKISNENGSFTMIIKASSVEVSETRGLEYVSN